MDPIAEFRADWAFRQEREAQEKARYAEMEPQILAAQTQLPKLLASVIPQLSRDLAGSFTHSAGPFFEDRYILHFAGIDVWFDGDQHTHRTPFVNLHATKTSQREVFHTRRLDILTLDESQIRSDMISILREALQLRSRPKAPMIPPPPRVI